MKIYEYQARALLDEYGIPVTKGKVADNPQDARNAASELGSTVVVKAQVLVGGRGKAGGIKLAVSPQEAFTKAQEILSMRIKGIPVEKVLVSEAVDIQKEYYLSITVDRTAKKVVCIASSSGGIDIEEIAATEPDKIMKLYINPLEGINKDELKKFLSITFSRELIPQAEATVINMYKLLKEKDCSLVEINPYVLAGSGRLIAVDAKMIFDDNGIFKHQELEELRGSEEYSEDEIYARESGLSFVHLDGDIGCIVNGAGLAMATMDIIKLLGGKPANFLDVGGSSSPSKTLNALKIILKNKKVKAILINIFGGITRCDDIANGIVMTMEQIDIPVPLVIRLVGTNQKEGRDILRAKGFDSYDGLTDAVKNVIKVAYM
ncbi:MAG: ADP-forming succinate--CoA ligase subunit beta [Spirochaetota bacterium]|nr:MAG: ADP-forming succinate--CoA ligase subunit beta [Spirochaetota bacterium]